MSRRPVTEMAAEALVYTYIIRPSIHTILYAGMILNKTNRMEQNKHTRT